MELFNFINSLTAINNSIAFERVDDSIVVRKSDKNRTLTYIAKVPLRYFNIDETVAFYKYDNFYKFLSNIKNAELEIDDNDIVISKQGSNPIHINYRLSDVEGIINGPKSVEFEDWDVKFVLSKEDLAEIVKINTFVKGTKAKIICDNKDVSIYVYTSGNDNSFAKEFKSDRVSENNDDISFTILANRFNYLPAGYDYTVEVSSEKFIKISLIHDEIEFNIYTGEISVS
jgi:hypothetical protein